MQTVWRGLSPPDKVIISRIQRQKFLSMVFGLISLERHKQHLSGFEPFCVGEKFIFSLGVKHG